MPEGACVIDVGTDHGQLPVWLVQSGRAARAIACDVNPGPLCRAAALVEQEDLSDCVRLLVCDGLTGLGPEDGDCVVIAGMGGETMVHILSKAPWTREGTVLILQPQSKGEELRRFLMGNGYRIEREVLVQDAGRIYPLLTACGGVSGSYTEAELYLGQWDQIGNDPLLGDYLAALMRKTEKASAFDSEMAVLLAELKQWKERI